MSRLRRILAPLATLLIGVLASALLMELGVLVLVGEQARFPRRVVGAPFGLRINEPGAHYRHASHDTTVEFRINRQGMRADRDFAYEKPSGLKRIVSIGDSFTIGYEVEVEQTFSNVLEAELRSRGYSVEILNAGVSGYSTAEACLYLERELLRYDPDLVLYSFFSNDLVDNTRTGLFRLEEGELVETGTRYVPGGRLADFLNQSAFFNFLSERSNAFVFLKERATLLAKRRMLDENVANVGAKSGEQARPQRLLAAAILERTRAELHRRGIPFVIQSIPTPTQPGGRRELIEMFPFEEFDLSREGVSFFPAKSVLDPVSGHALLYHERSHGHWTPKSHELAGTALASLIDGEQLLGRPGG